MSLASRITSLSTRIATELKAIRGELAGKANSSHTHVATTDLTATGTKSSATFLRGDNTWNVPPDTTYSLLTEPQVEDNLSTFAGLVSGERLARAVNSRARPITWVPTWNDILSKPMAFEPVTHEHSAGELTSGTIPDARLPSRLGIYAETVTDWNSVNKSGWYMANGATNAPTTGWYIGTCVVHNGAWVIQDVWPFTQPDFYNGVDSNRWRRVKSNNVWGSWYRIRETQAELDSRYVQTIEPGSGNFRRARGVIKWEQTAANIVGDLVIQTNLTFGNYMTELDIQGYNYTATDTIIDLKVAFYAAAGPAFTNVATTNDGTFKVANVRLMRRTSDSKVAIVITSGAPSAYWQYPKLAIDAIVGHTATTDAMFQGWTATITSDLTAYTAMTTVTVVNKSISGHTHPVTELTATGTRSSATYLRGDNTWATPPNTTYSAQTQAEAESSVDATARLTTGQRLYQAIVKHARPATWVPSWAEITGKPPEYLREYFGDTPDGTPSTTAQTGQTMVNYAPSAPASMPYVRNGFLSTATPSSALHGSYRITQLNRDVVRVGAQFAFTPYTVAGGILAISIQATSITTGTPVPVSPLHVQISATGWSVEVNDTAGTAVESIASGAFPTALTANSTTLHTVEAVVDKERGCCYLFLPSGEIVTLADSRFSLSGRWVYVEPFKTDGSLSSKSDALIRTWWADANPDSVPEVRSQAMASRSVVTAFPTGAATAVPTNGTDLVVPNSTITVTHGPTGGALIFYEGYFGVSNADVNGAGRLHIWVYYNGSRLLRRSVDAIQGPGPRSVHIPVMDTPGARRTYQIAVSVTAPLVANLIQGSLADHHGGHVVTATPF